ncbi:hypothetical protein DV495_003407 [Geotrichum candidum]|nr:hypothetical protein DV495_003407 [Geotrichum candidum]
MCVKRYEPDTVAPYWRELWDGLKFEVIHGSEENTPELTLDVLRELASTLSRASDQANYESYLEAVITETKENITEIQNKKALPSIRLASGIAASSESVFNKISQAILTTILDASAKSPTIAAQRIILEMIGCFVKSSINFSGENLLVPYKDSILEFYSKSLMGAAKIELTLRISAIQHLSELTTVKNLLSSEEVGLIVQYLNDVLLDDNKQELKEEALKALVVISDLNVEHILTLSFPALLARLPDTESTTEEGLKEIEDILYSLAHITVSRSTLEAFKNPQESLGSLEVFTWITKAFVIKADAYGFEFTKILIELLADPKLGGFVSKALDIVGDDDAIFSKENNSVNRLLYKQRYFTFVLDPLVNGFKSHVSSPDIQANYLVAMSGVLRHMPPKVISNDVPTFFPLLLQSLVIKDSKVREASISTITATLHESSEVVAQHLSSLIPQLLAAASEKTSPSSKVRITALNCLGEFPSSIPRKDIESFRLSIIKGLSVPLDDKKRDVRRAAVNARQKYFELNAAE